MYMHKEKAMWGHSKKVNIWALKETKPAKTLILDFQPPNCEKINLCCLSHPFNSIFLGHSLQTNTQDYSFSCYSSDL